MSRTDKETLQALLGYVVKHFELPASGQASLSIDRAESGHKGWTLHQHTANHCLSVIYYASTMREMETYLRGALLVADFHERYPGGSAVRSLEWFERSA